MGVVGWVGGGAAVSKGYGRLRKRFWEYGFGAGGSGRAGPRAGGSGERLAVLLATGPPTSRHRPCRFELQLVDGQEPGEDFQAGKYPWEKLRVWTAPAVCPEPAPPQPDKPLHLPPHCPTELAQGGDIACSPFL